MLLASEVLPKYFTTTGALTAGAKYTFKIKARNSVGLSEFSAPLEILAA